MGLFAPLELPRIQFLVGSRKAYEIFLRVGSDSRSNPRSLEKWRNLLLEGIGSYYGNANAGALVGGFLGETLGGSGGAFMRGFGSGTAKAAGRTLAWQMGGATVGAGVGWYAGGSLNSALLGASFGTMAGGIAQYRIWGVS